VLKSALQAELSAIEADAAALESMRGTAGALRDSCYRAVQLYQRAVIFREGLEGIKRVLPSVSSQQEAAQVGAPAQRRLAPPGGRPAACLRVVCVCGGGGGSRTQRQVLQAGGSQRIGNRVLGEMVGGGLTAAPLPPPPWHLRLGGVSAAERTPAGFWGGPAGAAAWGCSLGLQLGAASAGAASAGAATASTAASTSCQPLPIRPRPLLPRPPSCPGVQPLQQPGGAPAQQLPGLGGGRLQAAA
jgi:hypothetical protein